MKNDGKYGLLRLSTEIQETESDDVNNLVDQMVSKNYEVIQF